jgi:GNAT superfamily N-acetyltransferase
MRSVRETVIFLEMTSPGQLAPGRPAPAPMHLEEVGPDGSSLLRGVYVRIAAAVGWAGRSAWSDQQWEHELSQPGVRTWIARVRDEVAGLLELEVDPEGNVGIVIFGLLPEFLGKGFGGAFLTSATRLAWQMVSPSGAPTKRVWVQTSSRDHPHALTNYQTRGFRTFRTELPTGSDEPEPSRTGEDSSKDLADGGANS